MNKTALDDVRPYTFGAKSDRRNLSESLATTEVAINHYRIAAGESLPGGLHTHVDQEEVYIVVDGEATFETMDDTITVAASEAVRFAPGEYHSGTNGSDTELVVLAIGAPRETTDVRIPASCPNCDHDSLRLDTEGAELRFTCPDCAATQTPADCPTCGSTDLRITLDERGDPVTVCSDCAATFENPPLRE